MRRTDLIALLLVWLTVACGNDTEEADATGPTDAGGEIQAITYDGDLEIGEPRRFVLWTHCGIEWLGKFNGEEWVLVGDTPTGQVSSGWDAHMNPSVDEEIDLRLELQENGRIEVRPLAAPADQTVEYETSTEENPGCD